MRYLTLSELIYINGALHASEALMTGKQKVRDVELLQSAVQRPAASAFGQDAYPTLREKVAALAHSLARNHPFTDGNKRTAVVASVFMFAVNGQRVAWQPEDALATFVRLAENQVDVPALADWFTLEDAPASPEPDLERDTAAIARILHEHQWLLNELQSR
jgi:death on curing protein